MCNILVPNMTRRRNGNDPILVLPSFDSLSLPFRKSLPTFGNLDIHELSITIRQLYENATFGPPLQSADPLVPTRKEELLVSPLLTLFVVNL